MKITSAVLSLFLAVLVSGTAFAQTLPRHRPQTDINVNPAVTEALAARVKSEACSFAGTVSCGASRSSTTQSCTDGEYFIDFWQFSATAGQQITVTVSESTPYDILVAVQRTDGEIMARNYGSGTVTLSYTFPASTTYSISLGFIAKYYRGAYNMSISCGSTGGGQCQVSAHLTKSVPLTTDVGNSTACSGDDSTVSKVFSFDAVEGEPVEITINGSVAIEGQSYASASQDEGYSGNGSATPGMVDYIYFPRSTGRHYVWVGPYDSNVRSGSYTVVVDDVEFGACKRRVVRH